VLGYGAVTCEFGTCVCHVQLVRLYRGSDRCKNVILAAGAGGGGGVVVSSGL
jgi:hypothetical protein